MRQLKRTRARGATAGHAQVNRVVTRGLFAAPCVVTLVVAASSFSTVPSRAETATQAKANECLSGPKGLAPAGKHWFYRLERPSGRKCWYLGLASNRKRVEATTERRNASAAKAERSAAKPAAPPPKALRTVEAAPPERPTPRPVEAAPRERPAPRIVQAAPPDAVAQAPTVSAGAFSGQWPSMPTAVVPYSNNPGATVGHTIANNAASTIGNDTGNSATSAADAPTPDTTTETTLAGDSRPAAIAAARANAATSDVATAQPSEPAGPTLGQLLIFFTASAAFVAIAFRATLDLSAIWLTRRRRRRMPPAPVFVRPPAQTARPVLDEEADPSRDPDWLHKRLAAMRRDPNDRANLPLVADDPPVSYDHLPPRRRAVA